MIHEMRLDAGPFLRMKSGQKKIEIRINDEKRQAVRVGDGIIFSKRPDLLETLRVKVVKIEHFKTFAELLRVYPEQTGVEKRYSADEEKRYGVVVFHVSL